MPEEQWCACTDPRLQLVFLEGRASERKARLFACGVGRALWPFLGDDRRLRAVEIAEDFADGRTTATELAAAKEAALDAKRGAASQIVAWVPDHGPWQSARMVVVSIQQSRMEKNANDW